MASPPADRVIVGSTAAGSTRWSNTATNTGSSGSRSDSPTKERTWAAGVVNVHDTDRSRRLPVADSVPRGTSSRYSVAAGNRSITPGSTSKRSVRVPIHRQRPPTAGAIVTGTSAVSSWSSVPSGTIGWLKVDRDERCDVDRALGLEPHDLERPVVGRHLLVCLVGGRERRVDRDAGGRRGECGGRAVEGPLVVGREDPVGEPGEDLVDDARVEWGAVDHGDVVGGSFGRPALAEPQSDGRRSVGWTTGDGGDLGRRSRTLAGRRRHGRLGVVVAVVSPASGQQHRRRQGSGEQPSLRAVPGSHRLPLYGRHRGWTLHDRTRFPNRPPRDPTCHPPARRRPAATPTCATRGMRWCAMVLRPADGTRPGASPTTTIGAARSPPDHLVRANVNARAEGTSWTAFSSTTCECSR